MQNAVGEGEVLVTFIPGKKVPERFYNVRPSEIDLSERRSATKIPLSRSKAGSAWACRSINDVLYSLITQ
jgi:hypothetical protein